MRRQKQFLTNMVNESFDNTNHANFRISFSIQSFEKR